MDLMCEWAAFIEHSLCIEEDTKGSVFSHRTRRRPCYGTAVRDLRAGLLYLSSCLAGWLYHVSFQKTSQLILNYSLLVLGLTTTIEKGKGSKVKLPKMYLLKQYLTTLFKLHPISPCRSLILVPACLTHSTYHHLRHSRVFLFILLSYDVATQTKVHWGQGLFSALSTAEFQQGELRLHRADAQYSLFMPWLKA